MADIINITPNTRERVRQFGARKELYEAMKTSGEVGRTDPTLAPSLGIVFTTTWNWPRLWEVVDFNGFFYKPRQAANQT